MIIKDNMLCLEEHEIINLNKKGIKKITGTNFGVLLGLNAFQKKGEAILSMFRTLPKEKIDEFYTKRGAIAEKLVHIYLMLTNQTFKTWDAKTIKWDSFPKDPDFGGLLDIGISSPRRYVGEVKSSNVSNKEKLLSNQCYINQGKLYCELSKTEDLSMFYVMFTDEEEEKIKNDLFVISKEQVQLMIKENRLIINSYKVDFEEVRANKRKALEYKEECIYLYNYSVPLEDISNSMLEKLGFNSNQEDLLF